MMPGEILKYSIEVAVATPSQAVRVTPGRRVTVHSGPDSEVGHWQPRVGPESAFIDGRISRRKPHQTWEKLFR